MVRRLILQEAMDGSYGYAVFAISWFCFRCLIDMLGVNTIGTDSTPLDVHYIEIHLLGVDSVSKNLKSDSVALWPKSQYGSVSR